MKYANMHLHSVHSDGIYTPAELCQTVKEMGYGAIVLSDHETANGTAEIKAAAAALGLDTMVGMELYAKGPDTSFHILAYDFDPTEKEMAATIEEMRRSMELVTRARFEACVAGTLLILAPWQEDQRGDSDYARFHNLNSLAAAICALDADTAMKLTSG